MFDKKLLESAEFYQRRYRNFATLIIVPVFLFFLFLVLFSLFAKRELTVKVPGQLVPRQVLSVVQSTSSNPIELNNLKEGKHVKKGDVLLTYKDDDGSASKTLVESQLKTANDRLTALDTYKQSIEAGASKFQQPDSFGYSDMFNNYIAQVNTLSADYNQQVSDKAAADQQVDQQKSALNVAAEQSAGKIVQYHAVLSAINNDNNNGLSGNPYAYLYDSYKAQANGLTGDDKEKVKQTAVATVKQAMDQVSESVTNYQTQAASVGKGAQVSQAATDDKAASLKSDQLASATKEYADQKAVVDKLNAQSTSVNSEIATNTLTADKSGVLHILTGKTNPKYLSKGSEVAEIYPDLAKEPAIDVEFMVPADKIAGIKMDEKVRFRVVKSVSKPIIIEGRVSEVDTTATATKEGNVFKVTAKVKLTDSQYKQIKYGSVGQITIITGEKTWFNYIVDQIFKDEE